MRNDVEISEYEAENNYELMKAMNTIVLMFNDEEGMIPWFYIMPDEVDDEELREMASDPETVNDVCIAFRAAMRRCARSGWYTGGFTSIGHVYGIM